MLLAACVTRCCLTAQTHLQASNLHRSTKRLNNYGKHGFVQHLYSNLQPFRNAL